MAPVMRPRYAAIDRYLMPAVAAVDRQDRQADGRTPDRYTNPAVTAGHFPYRTFPL